MDREVFIKELFRLFPEVTDAISDYSHGLLHCEMADFRRVVESAMDQEQYWRVENYLRFVDECREHSGTALLNAIEVSFLEDFAFGEFTDTRHKAVCERMPVRLRKRLLEFNNRWA